MGVIDLALASLRRWKMNERLKWHVKGEKLGGKPSKSNYMEHSGREWKAEQTRTADIGIETSYG